MKTLLAVLVAVALSVPMLVNAQSEHIVPGNEVKSAAPTVEQVTTCRQAGGDAFELVEALQTVSKEQIASNVAESYKDRADILAYVLRITTVVYAQTSGDPVEIAQAVYNTCIVEKWNAVVLP